MPAGKIKMFDEGRGFGFIKPDDGGVDVFLHISALREGDEITQGKAVKFEIGVDPKSGKTKALSVDLTYRTLRSVRMPQGLAIIRTGAVSRRLKPNRLHPVLRAIQGISVGLWLRGLTRESVRSEAFVVRPEF